MSRFISRLMLLVGAFVLNPALLAQDKIPGSLPNEYVFTIEASISAAVVMGDSVDGQRQAIPITGGRVKGVDINGEVLAGGADYQVLRADGSRMITAVYMIRTDDGALINVVNEGLILPPAAGETTAYFRTAPKFTAPLGKYGWLNTAIFICGVRFSPQQPNTVLIDVYKVL